MTMLSPANVWRARRAARKLPPAVLAFCVALLLTIPLISLSGTAGAGQQRAAGEAGPAAQAAIRSVIEGQLDAFQRDDWAAAFSHASPGIQQKFGSLDVFMAMVTGGYPAVYRPRSVQFGELRQVNGRLAQLVHLVGPDGRSVMAAYFMERQPDGSWRIAGVQLIALPEEAV